MVLTGGGWCTQLVPAPLRLPPIPHGLAEEWTWAYMTDNWKHDIIKNLPFSVRLMNRDKVDWSNAKDCKVLMVILFTSFGTHYYWPLHIVFYGIILQDFYDFAVKSRLFSETHHEDKTVYVVPAFEARETVASPRTKTELLKLVDGGDIRPFYIELCWKCQVMLILSKRCVYKSV